VIATERIESLKAGGIGALAVAPAFGVITGVNQWAMTQFLLLDGWNAVAAHSHSWLSGAIALVAGSLFGITYRYIIRQDQNSHLKSGAVLAFGLVRGLAQVDLGLTSAAALVPMGVMAGESVILFAVAQIGLDWAIGQGWLKPFGGER
jgi:hypothetical protein